MFLFSSNALLKLKCHNVFLCRIDAVTHILYNYSQRARNRLNQVVEAKRFEGVFLCRKAYF